MASNDPFFVVKEEVDETLQSLQEKYNRWQTAVGGSRQNLEQQIQDDCHSLVYMVTEIDKSIDAAEKNPARFRLTQAEISDRRKWVMSTRRKVETITTGLTNKNTTSTSTSSSAPPTATSKLQAAAIDENDRFISSEGDRQQVLMQRQDRELEDLSVHVVRIGELGREMGQELHTQGQMLDDLDMEMQGTSTRLAAAQKKVQYVMDRAGTKGQLMIIVALIVVLIILILIAIG